MIDRMDRVAGGSTGTLFSSQEGFFPFFFFLSFFSSLFFSSSRAFGRATPPEAREFEM